jgi:hypothetical protein
MFVVCDHLIRTITLVDQFGVYSEFVVLTSHVNPPTFWNIRALGTDVGVVTFLVAFLRQSQLLGREGSQFSKTLEESHLLRLTRGGILPTRDTYREGHGRSREEQFERGHPKDACTRVLYANVKADVNSSQLDWLAPIYPRREFRIVRLNRSTCPLVWG